MASLSIEQITDLKKAYAFLKNELGDKFDSPTENKIYGDELRRFLMEYYNDRIKCKNNRNASYIEILNQNKYWTYASRYHDPHENLIFTDKLVCQGYTNRQAYSGCYVKSITKLELGSIIKDELLILNNWELRLILRLTG